MSCGRTANMQDSNWLHSFNESLILMVSIFPTSELWFFLKIFTEIKLSCLLKDYEKNYIKEIKRKENHGLLFNDSLFTCIFSNKWFNNYVAAIKYSRSLWLKSISMWRNIENHYIKSKIIWLKQTQTLLISLWFEYKLQ